jgi:putative SOS response-associated peptidase YedK
MCGRFTITTDLQILVERFNILNDLSFEYQPRYNIAPSQPVPAIINDGKANRMGLLKWGLIPSWSKEKAQSYKMINARAETLTIKTSFKNLLKSRRCLIPADSFYEWKKENGGKIPMRMLLKDNKLFAMAGLWDSWISPAGETVNTFTIITTAPNELLKPIHDRMPVILTPEKEQLWLDPVIDFKLLNEILVPYPASKMDYYAVSTFINSTKNDTPECILPVK